MALADPDQPDDDLLAFLEQELSDVEIPNVVDVRTISDLKLIEMVQECDRSLEKMGELHSPSPRSEVAREIHSQRGALLIEMSRRGLR